MEVYNDTIMQVYNDWDSLFERFCIMTVDGGLSDFTAINYLMDKAPKPLITKLMDFSKKQERLLK
jgi:hypothetical protein